MGKVTSKEIAKIAGVSVSAVSIVLNNKPGVSDETRKKILHILAENGIFPKSTNLVDSARGAIRFCKVVKHGGIINDKHNAFISDYIDGVVDEAKEKGCVVEFATYNTPNIADVVSQVMNTKGLLGCVVLSTELAQEDIELFGKLDVACVFLDTVFENFPAAFVTMDNYGMVYEAIKYLKERGHTDIGMLSAEGASNFKQRRLAFTSAMIDLGLVRRADRIYAVRSTYAGAFEDMQTILARTDRGKLPTAFFACNDMVAIGAVQALHEAGLKVPQDVSVIGFDDLPASMVVVPPLTTMYVPKHEIGKIAVRLLLDNVEAGTHRCKSQKFVLGGSLIERQSVKTLES